MEVQLVGLAHGRSPGEREGAFRSVASQTFRLKQLAPILSSSHEFLNTTGVGHTWTLLCRLRRVGGPARPVWPRLRFEGGRRDTAPRSSPAGRGAGDTTAGVDRAESSAFLCAGFCLRSPRRGRPTARRAEHRSSPSRPWVERGRNHVFCSCHSVSAARPSASHFRAPLATATGRPAAIRLLVQLLALVLPFRAAGFSCRNVGHFGRHCRGDGGHWARHHTAAVSRLEIAGRAGEQGANNGRCRCPFSRRWLAPCSLPFSLSRSTNSRARCSSVSCGRSWSSGTPTCEGVSWPAPRPREGHVGPPKTPRVALSL